MALREIAAVESTESDRRKIQRHRPRVSQLDGLRDARPANVLVAETQAGGGEHRR